MECLYRIRFSQMNFTRVQEFILPLFRQHHSGSDRNVENMQSIVVEKATKDGMFVPDKIFANEFHQGSRIYTSSVSAASFRYRSECRKHAKHCSGKSNERWNVCTG